MNNKFKSLGMKNYKNIYDWIYLDFCITNNNNIKNKISLMGKNGIGKTNFMYYFHELSYYFKNSNSPVSIGSEFDISLIVDNFEFQILGEFYKNNEKETCVDLNIEFTSALSSSKRNKKYYIGKNYLKICLKLKMIY